LAQAEAYFVSIPATWFDYKWGEQVCQQMGMKAKLTYFVAFLVGSEKNLLEFKIIGDNDKGSLMKHATASTFRDFWLAHGKRKCAFYCLHPIWQDIVENPGRTDRIKVPDAVDVNPWRWGELEKGTDHYETALHPILDAALTALLDNTDPRLFPWSNNNCHIDTWFVVQLAFYTFSPFNCPGEPHTWPDAYRKLFRVLSCVGDTKLAPANRDLYLRYEQRVTGPKAPARASRGRRWGEVDDYSKHTSVMVRYALREDKPNATKIVRADRLTGVVVDTPCSECNATPRHTLWYVRIPASRFWYPMSDLTHQQLPELEKMKTHHNTHQTMRDVLLTHIHRNDFTQLSCNQHAHESQEIRNIAYTIKMKHGTLTRLPRMIELDNGDAGVSYIVKNSIFTYQHGLTPTITISDEIVYQLIALTYYNTSHYVTSVLLHNKWYMYNDMGHRMYSNKKSIQRTATSFIECDFEEAATPPKGFSHRTYVYSLVGESPTQAQMDQVDFTEYEDPLFHAMDMLAASDDDNMEPDYE
jgi:hypothetical protein